MVASLNKADHTTLTAIQSTEVRRDTPLIKKAALNVDQEDLTLS